MRESFDLVVLAGGDPGLGAAALDGFDLVGPVVAADSGAELADALGLPVSCAVGDFDSLDPARLDALEASNSVEVRRHPRDKDATDLALALDHALERAGDTSPGDVLRVLVGGVEGGRADHALANLLLIASPRYRSMVVTVALVGSTVRVVHDDLVLDVAPGDTLSVLPVHGSARVSIDGVRWPLRAATLEPGTTWGMSNEATGAAVQVTVHSGTALVFEQSV